MAKGHSLLSLAVVIKLVEVSFIELQVHFATSLASTARHGQGAES
jgi:hypothetical protein